MNKCEKCGFEFEGDECPDCGPFALHDAVAAIRDKETPQDAGQPSPVPYSLIIQKPSPDLPQEGVEKVYFTGAFTDITGVTRSLYIITGDLNLGSFIRESFERGAYRVEVIRAEWSIKVYKHPNNP